MEGAPKIRVVIADDDEVARVVVGAMIDRAPELELVGVGVDAYEAFELVSEYHPDVVVIDLHMPGGGGAAVARIKGAFPDVRALVLTADDEDQTKRMLAAVGADGYILKRAVREELIANLTHRT